MKHQWDQDSRGCYAATVKFPVY